MHIDKAGKTVVDCCVRHSWGSQLEVFEYLSAGWRDYVIANTSRAWHDYMLGHGDLPNEPIQSPMSIDLAYVNPEGNYVPGSIAAGAEAGGSDYETMRKQHLEPAKVERAVLCHGLGAMVPGLPTSQLTVELVKAINDWSTERWLSADPRFYSVVLVAAQFPGQAASEIRRVGRHDRVAAVMLCVNGLARPFGHPAYYPIYEAAQEMDLPVVILSGCDAQVETASYPTAAGLPGTYSEYRALAPQVLMTHIASLIAQGVMERYPSLRFMALGGGVAWITPFLWRMNNNQKTYRLDVPWMKDDFSGYFRRYFRVGTHPFRYAADRDRLARYLAVEPGLKDVLCYASGYPDWDSQSPAAVEAALPEGWASPVMRENALEFFRWPVAATTQPEGNP